MNIHEYQSKQILKEFGVKVPNGSAAFSPEEAARFAKDLSTDVVVVKAQIHAGGRGKAGGVKLAHNIDEVKSYASALLGRILVTHQTGPEGKEVHRLLIEEASDIEKEYYLSLTVDRKTAQIVMMGSAEGGMEIEEVAAKTPEKIFKEYIDPGVGLMPFQTKRMAYNMGFKQSVIAKASKTMECLYNAFVAKDCSLAEINPLVVTKQGEVVALDAKLNFDDSGLYRHPDIEALRDIDEEDPKERAAASEPANFLDVGGDSTVDKIAEAFRIMQSDDQVHSVFVNIFGGINKCDVIAAGIVEAAKVVGLRVPVIARLDGTNVEEGRRILREANVPGVHMAKNMVEGAKLAVELAKEKKLQARIKG